MNGFDPLAGTGLKKPKTGAGPMIIHGLPWNLLYTKSEIDAKLNTSSGGIVKSVVAGTNVTVNNADPTNPIVSAASGSGGITQSISSVSTNTNAGSTANINYIYIATGSITITLPTAVSNTNIYTIINVGSGTITVATTSSQTINGSSTATLPIANMSLDIVSDNTNWHVQ